MNQRLDVLQALGQQFEHLSLEPRPVRRRARWGWQRRTIAVVGVVLIAAGGAAAAVTLTQGSHPLVSLSGSETCPNRYPYWSFSRPQKVVYPTNYPGLVMALGNNSGPVCFESLNDAEHAGYKVAPVPTGDTTLGSLYTARAPQSLRSACRTATRKLHTAVYCPTRLPVPWWQSVDYVCTATTPTCSAPIFDVSGNFIAPNTYLPPADLQQIPPSAVEPTATVAVTIWQATDRQRQQHPDLLGCQTTPRLVTDTTFRGHKAEWFQCLTPNGNMSSMLEWHQGHEAYGISAEGLPRLRERVVRYIAKHMVAYKAS